VPPKEKLVNTLHVIYIGPIPVDEGLWPFSPAPTWTSMKFSPLSVRVEWAKSTARDARLVAVCYFGYIRRPLSTPILAKNLIMKS
jgi:hypothetical protein